MRAHLLRGDIDAAMSAALQLSSLDATRPDPTDLLVDDALDQRRVHLARQAIAAVDGTVSAAQTAQLKARVALAENDHASAKAILVMAIETAPDNVPLRTLLTEVMVAAGTAAEARAVLAHIGKPPVNPVDPAAPAAPADGYQGDLDRGSPPTTRIG